MDRAPAYASGGWRVADHKKYMRLSSILKAFAFQEMMMDAYATGNTIRLTQSYSDGGLEST